MAILPYKPDTVTMYSGNDRQTVYVCDIPHMQLNGWSLDDKKTQTGSKESKSPEDAKPKSQEDDKKKPGKDAPNSKN